MAVTDTPAMTEGKAAKVAGAPHLANPYPSGSQQSADWLEGYTYDEAEMNVDHPEGDEG
ncbi:MAG: hypothetical protein K2Y56_07465 [Methylobacterium sp.]|uniref:hypothetical protein n=1 Tax=Methylobacterium sp. TaxID=409 RepID=UPI0025F51A1D|nr:hypothetical protein [Methylobacterium sp.]MBX9931362.1 hypothetical protein [Methylobacterium sp.]